MPTSIGHIGKSEHLDRMIAHASALNLPGRVELLRAVRFGAIALVELDRSASAPLRLLRQTSRPVVCLLGDDDYRSVGPSGWAAWPGLGHWARAGLVHAGGGDSASYAVAIDMTLEKQRLILIETDGRHGPGWSNALSQQRIQHLLLIPAGGVHPVAPARGAMQ